MLLRKLLFFFFFSSCYTFSPAKISLPAIFQDGMVLQQNSYVSIWGNAAAGEAITVLGSWDSVSTSTYADTKGQWRVQIPTPGAGGPFLVNVEGENKLIIRDVWIGEVWIASGQSNMDWPLTRSEGGEAEAARANYPQIRFFKVERAVSSTPRIDCKGVWKALTPVESGGYSSVAYYFAKKLHEELGIPIGIIQTAWGGTPAEAWTPRDNLESQPDFQPMMRDFDNALSRHREFPNEYQDPIHAKSPGILYNSMLAPLIPYTLRGALWYQGEANTYDPWLYRKLFPLMVESWRRNWGYRFSFYYVQIAPFAYGVPQSGTGIREAQYLSRKIARSGMVSTLDIGNPANIHPTQKKQVGDRLALHALAKDYGREALVFEGPVVENNERIGEELRLEFSQADLVLKKGATGFEIAGQDKQFYAAEARIEGKYLFLKSPSVPVPVACRYAWSDTASASLFNKEGLPASSFRTDDWPVFYSQLDIQPEYDRIRDQFNVSIDYKGSEAHEIYYTINGAEPSVNSPRYEKAIFVKGPLEIKATVALDGVKGQMMVSRKILDNKALRATLLSQTSADSRYKGAGIRSLINGVEAGVDFQDTEWLGYPRGEAECILDFGERKEFQQVKLNFLSQVSRNILPPTHISVYWSKNGKKFKLLSESKPVAIPLETSKPAEIVHHELNLSGKKFRYLKIEVNNHANLPEQERGAQNSWLFLDEILVE